MRLAVTNGSPVLLHPTQRVLKTEGSLKSARVGAQHYAIRISQTVAFHKLRVML